MEGVSYPVPPSWNVERPHLTGDFFFQDNKGNSLRTTTKGCAADDGSNGAVTPAITCLAPSVQELLLIDDLLHTMVGIEGKYIEVKKGIHPEGSLTFHVDPSMELSLQDPVKRVLPLCENYIAIIRFMESRLHFRYGLVNHAFAAALRAILQSLLDLALRTSVASSDPYHEDLTCNVEEAPLVKQLNDLREISSLMTELNLSIENTEVLTDSDISSQTASIGITGFETFTVNYKVQWPLSLVISRRALIKYQVIFRLLFHCKHVERQLSGTWLLHQMTRCLDFKGSSVSESYVLCQRMMHFIQSFVHYLTFEVLEPNWHAMYNKLQNAISIDEVIQLHDFCLNTCMKQCLLLWPQIFEKIEKLKSICIQYATATQWLIPSMSLPDSRQQITTMSSQTEQSMRRRGWKGRQSRSQLLKVWKSSDESTFKTTLRRIREEFDKEIRNFKSFLMSGSQKEPHLAHLAHNLQDVENEL